MKNRTKKLIAACSVAVLGLTLVACDDPPGATKEEQAVARQQLDQFSSAQPVPIFNYSQLRQNLIEIEEAQANATVTTSFFFNLGVVDPVHTCPSIGFPIPGTFQLTNPMQTLTYGQGGGIVWPQLEANGVYTGDTAATTAICIDSQGRGYAHWWEGSVSTVAGPATWDYDAKLIVLTGEPTAEFTTGAP